MKEKNFLLKAGLSLITLASILASCSNSMPTNSSTDDDSVKPVIEELEGVAVAENTNVSKMNFGILAATNFITASNLSFPVAGSDWTNAIGSSYHRKNGGFNGADDTYALDLNKNKPVFDDDYHKVVKPIAPGRIVTSYHPGGTSSGNLSFTLVEHDTPLKLDDGTVLKKWFSGYMHANAIIGVNLNVNTSSVLGYVGHEGAKNNHLHFAIYSGSNTKGGLVSINIATKLKAFARNYK